MVSVPVWELTIIDFQPQAAAMQTRNTVQWVALEGNEPALSVHVRAEEVLENSTSFDVSALPLRDPDHFVAGQLHSCITEWDYIFKQNSNESSEMVRSWITHGIDVTKFFTHFQGNFKGQSYNSHVPPKRYFANASICKSYVPFIVQELNEGLRSGSIRFLGKVGECAPPKVIMPLTVEPSKPRLCHDERFLNLWIKDCPFKVETLKDVNRLIGRNVLIVAFDEKSGYSHLLLSESSQTYFGIQFGGWLFCYCALPFGFKAAAFIYQTVGMQVTSYLRSYGILSMQYIDDRMAATTEEQVSDSCAVESKKSSCGSTASATQIVYTLLEIMTRLGYTLALKKCQLRPSTKIKFLGFFVDSEKEAFLLPDDKKEKFITLRENILASKSVDVRTLQRFAGKCVSFNLQYLQQGCTLGK